MSVNAFESLLCILLNNQDIRIPEKHQTIELNLLLDVRVQVLCVIERNFPELPLFTLRQKILSHFSSCTPHL